MKRIRKSRKPATAEAIARRAERGEDVSHSFTNTGRMMDPIRRGFVNKGSGHGQKTR